jgi:hypothetical protein
VSERWRDRVAVLVSASLAVLLLGPALGPGYSLVVDQVFVPDQDLLPWMAGLGGGLPRAVPQDTVVALLSGPVPGWVLQSLALLTAITALGAGMGRLVRPAGRRAAVAATVLACWSPFVVERLLMGHWSLLLAVAMTPWALHHARAARDGAPGAAARWLLVVALASLTVSGALVVLVVSVPVLLWRGGTSGRRHRALAAVGGLLLQLPWAVPAALHPEVGASSAGSEAFALHAEGGMGAVLTALSTGGVWNVLATPGSRATWLAPLLALLTLGLALVGRRAVAAALGRPTTLTLVVVSSWGLLLAVTSAIAPDTLGWLVGHVPGAGVLRDGQKWLAPWLVLLTASAGCGAARLSIAVLRRWNDTTLAGTLLVALLVAPLACLPDAAWGSFGHLATVPYPDTWSQARTALAADPAPGDVVSLPWQAFRRFPWNRDRTVLDPAPRFMPRTVVVSGDLVVARPGDSGVPAPPEDRETITGMGTVLGDPKIVVVPGEDARARRLGAALAAGQDVDGTLRREGIGWALVAGPATDPVPFTGGTVVVTGPDLTLYRLRTPDPPPVLSGVTPVLVGNLVAAAIVLAAALALARRRWRRRSTSSNAGARATGW